MVAATFHTIRSQGLLESGPCFSVTGDDLCEQTIALRGGTDFTGRSWEIDSHGAKATIDATVKMTALW